MIKPELSGALRSESEGSSAPQDKTAGTPPSSSGQFVSEAISFLKTLAAFLLAAFILRATVVEAFKIPSGSMIPTLRIGDHILVSKLSYGLRLPLMASSVFLFDSPERADIVVFTRPDDPATIEDDSDTNVIKRVVGLPGDVVEVRDTTVYINNQILEESYARWQEGGLRDGNFGPERVPEGHIFLLGDNRDHSKDSRFWTEPFLPIERVKGRALIIYWSWDSMGRIGKVLR
jgi:signal peptidase I